MADSQPTSLLPPSTRDAFGTPTPSGLTPNTRQEVEFAFQTNALQQTDSAAPADDGLTEAQRNYRRPGGPIRASSMNYERALAAVRGQGSASSDLPDTTTTDEYPTTPAAKVTSPTQASVPFPPPGHGVVPRYDNIAAAGQADVVKKAGRNRGLSLSQLGRQQSFNEQDMKHMMQGQLMGQADGAGKK